jgi:hypothetical protein
MLRSHELCMGGYNYMYDKKVITVWSAPNYCHRCNNVAAVLEIYESGEIKPNVFAASPEAEKQQYLRHEDKSKEVPDYFNFVVKYD